MSEIALPAPRPPRSRFGMPRAALIDGAGAGAGGAGAGAVPGAGAGAGVPATDASAEVPDDPPPQAATHAPSRPITMSRPRCGLRRVVDGTDDDRISHDWLIAVDMGDISRLVACACAMQQESNHMGGDKVRWLGGTLV